jgi:DAPG hydrolase PhiG domain
VSAASASGPLAGMLARPMSAPDEELLAAIERGPIDVGAALARAQLQRLLDPRPLPLESGWCTLADGVGYVAVRTEMPQVTGAMVDWWFDWHARDSLRYCVWHPLAHRENSLELPASAGGAAKAHWGAVHHPVEDVGLGVVRARIEFVRPSELGFDGDALDDANVATIVCGWVGDARLRMRHTPMCHVFLRDGRGVVLRSRFWLGAALRPDGRFGAYGARLLNNRLVRHLALPRGLSRALALHCAEEYANLATLLPELHARFAAHAG